MSSMTSNLQRPSTRRKGDGQRTAAEWRVGDVVAVLRRRWTLIVLGLLAGAGAAVAYMLMTQPMYQSTAQIMVTRKNATLAARGAEGANENEVRVTDDLIATHMALIQSPQVVERALNDANLMELPSLLAAKSSDETVIDYVIDQLRATRGGSGQSKSAHVIKLSFDHTDANDAWQVTAALCKSYQQFLSERFEDVNQTAVVLIDKARKELSDEVDAAELAYQEFRQTSPSVVRGGKDESTSIHQMRYEEIQLELSQVRLKATEAKARLSIVEKQLTDPNLTDLQRLALVDEANLTRVGLLVSVDHGRAESPEFQAAQPQRMEKARAQYASLMALGMEKRALERELGAAHPEVQKLADQIAAAEEYLNKEGLTLDVPTTDRTLDPKVLVDAYVQLLKTDLATLNMREEALQALAETEAEEARKMVKIEVNGEMLRKQLDRKQELYNDVLERLRELNLVRDSGGFVNELIEKPRLGELVSPKPVLAVALGLAMAMFIAGCAIVYAEFHDRRFRSLTELQTTVDLPLLSSIPMFGRMGAPRAGRAAAGRGNRQLVVLNNPASQAAEAFRMLRTALLLGREGSNLKVIAFTSPLPGDGKSSVTSNLAVSIAQSGKSVLLIDADLRRPMLSKVFGIDGSRGLCDAIADGADYADLIVPSETDNLWIMPAGTIPENPSELLGQPGFEQLLETLRSKYDLIMIDCPPVIPVTDPCIIAPLTDGVLVVVRLATDSQPAVLRTRDQLEQTGATMLGVIPNAVDSRAGFDDAYGYGYEYRYSYGSSYSSDNGRGRSGSSNANGSSNGSEQHRNGSGSSERLLPQSR